jgi:Gpi18-like mannosyltransferase
MNRKLFYTSYLRIISLQKHPLFYVVVISILLRYALGVYTSWTFDVETWYRTVSNVLVESDLYDRFYFVYPPIWGYILGGSAKIASLFFDPASFGYQIQSGTIYSPLFRFEIVTSPLFNVIFKTPLIISDVLVGIIIYKFIHRLSGDTKRSKVGFMVWTFNPLVISISAIHGTFDTLATLFAIIAIVLAYRQTYFWSGAALALGTLTKIFPIFLIPVVFGFIFSTRYIPKDQILLFQKNLTFIIGFTSIIFILVSPYLIHGTYASAINVLLSWNETIEPGGLSMWILLLTFSPFQYNQLSEGNFGLIVLISTIIISILAILIAITIFKSGSKLRDIFLASIAVLSFTYLLSPVLLPQYLIWIFPFLIITYLCFVRIYKYAFIILSATGLVYFYSVHGIWHLFYPLAVFSESINFDSITKNTYIYLNTGGLITPYLHTDIVLVVTLITICILILMIFPLYTKFRSHKSVGLMA